MDTDERSNSKEDLSESDRELQVRTFKPKEELFSSSSLNEEEASGTESKDSRD